MSTRPIHRLPTAACLALLAGCASPGRSTLDTAQVICIAPVPADDGAAFAPRYSREAAQVVAQLLREQGYSAMMPSAKRTPDEVRVLDVAPGTHRAEVLALASRSGADLIAFVWVQRIEIGKTAAVDETKKWGGFVLCNPAGDELSGSRHSTTATSAAEATVPWLVVCEDGAARGRKQVREFAAWLLASPGRFSRALENAFAGD